MLLGRAFTCSHSNTNRLPQQLFAANSPFLDTKSVAFLTPESWTRVNPFFSHQQPGRRTSFCRSAVEGFFSESNHELIVRNMGQKYAADGGAVPLGRRHACRALERAPVRRPKRHLLSRTHGVDARAAPSRSGHAQRGGYAADADAARGSLVHRLITRLLLWPRAQWQLRQPRGVVRAAARCGAHASGRRY